MNSFARNMVRGVLPALLLSLGVGQSTPAHAGYDAGDYVARKGAGKIVYSSNQHGNFELYIMRGDGTGKARLTNSKENDTNPCLSPDGRRVLWVAGGQGDDASGSSGGRIWIMNLDGTRKKCLTPKGKTEDEPSFSFDGKKIVFTSGSENSNDIWIMNSDGRNRKRLTTNESDDVFAAFSPNGRRIVFESDRNGSYGIFIMDADGKNQKELGKNQGWSGIPQFSPDGKTIGFSCDHGNSGGNNSVFLMNADGRNRRKISQGNADERFVGFSPDGKRLVFASDRNVNTDIYTMDLKGKNLRRLTTGKAYETQPDWK